MKPTGAVLSIWGEGVAGMNAGCHTPKRGPSGEAPPPDELAKAALEPLPGLPIYVGNEAFGPMMCFAEGSLAMAEEALKRMNVSLPSSRWLNEELFASLFDPQAIANRPPTDPFLVPSSYGSAAPARSAPVMALAVEFRI